MCTKSLNFTVLEDAFQMRAVALIVSWILLQIHLAVLKNTSICCALEDVYIYINASEDEKQFARNQHSSWFASRSKLSFLCLQKTYVCVCESHTIQDTFYQILARLRWWWWSFASSYGCVHFPSSYTLDAQTHIIHTCFFRYLDAHHHVCASAQFVPRRRPYEDPPERIVLNGVNTDVRSARRAVCGLRTIAVMSSWSAVRCACGFPFAEYFQLRVWLWISNAQTRQGTNVWCA